MDESKQDSSSVSHNGKQRNQHRKETHGLRDDIDVNSPLSDVKAPNVFERAKEEIEALVEAFHHKKESKSHYSPKSHDSPSSYGEKTDSATKDCLESEKSESHSEKNGRSPKATAKAKEETKSDKHTHHHRETRGRSDDIDENTPTSKVKGPNVFERAKEEIEALVEAFHPKKDSGDAVSTPKKEG